MEHYQKGITPSDIRVLWSQVLDRQLTFLNEALNVEPLAKIDDTVTIIQGIHLVFGFKAEFSNADRLLPPVTELAKSDTRDFFTLPRQSQQLVRNVRNHAIHVQHYAMPRGV